MSEERLATALSRASNAAARIEAAIAAMPRDGSDDGAAAIKAAIAPILAELDAMIANAERGQR